MKKVLSILLAVALCFAFSVMAFATEETTAINTEELSSIVDEIVDAAGEADYEGLVSAVQINADQLAAAFGDIVEGADTVAADEAAEYVITAISDLTGADMENVREIVMDAIDEYGVADVEIVSSNEVAGLVDKILERLEEYGIDTEPVIDMLAESKLGNAVIGIYVGETTTVEEIDPPVTDTIIDTGAPSSVAAFAVLAVAAAGAFVCTRKKAE